MTSPPKRFSIALGYAMSGLPIVAILGPLFRISPARTIADFVMVICAVSGGYSWLMAERRRTRGGDE